MNTPSTNRLGNFLSVLEKSVTETYATYNEVDPGAKQLMSIAEDGILEGEITDPIYLRYTSYLTGKNDLIMHSAFIPEQDGDVQLSSRFFFVTTTHAVAVDVVINVNTLIVSSEIAYCEKSSDIDLGPDNDCLDIPNQTYDELDQIAQSISLLGRILKS